MARESVSLSEVRDPLPRHLKFIVNERRIKTDWSLYLPMVLRILNAEKIAGIGLSPAEILMPGLDLDRGMYPDDREEEFKRSLDEIPDPQRRKVVLQWVNHLKALQVQAIKTAGEFFRPRNDSTGRPTYGVRDTDSYGQRQPC